jgi:hypothetical protein
MTRGLMVIVVFVAAVASGGQEREAYPGQRNHAEPPKGWTCTKHPNVPKSSPHHCECKRTCVQNTDEHGQPMDGMHVARRFEVQGVLPSEVVRLSDDLREYVNGEAAEDLSEVRIDNRLGWPVLSLWGRRCR